MGTKHGQRVASHLVPPSSPASLSPPFPHFIYIQPNLHFKSPSWAAVMSTYTLIDPLDKIKPTIKNLTVVIYTML